MGVDDDAFGFAVRDTEYDVGGFASDAVELNQLVECVGNFAVMFRNNVLTAVADRSCLIAKKSRASDQSFEFRRFCTGEIDDRAIFFEQGGCDDVNAGIGALRTEDGRDEKLQRVLMMQRTLRVWIRGAQSSQDRPATRQ